jgi:hypothetical protein
MIQFTALPRSIKRISQMVLLAGMLVSASNANTILTLNPVNGALSGHAGQLVGWGFTIQDDTFWLTVAGTDFCSSFTGTFACDPTHPVSNGSYMDFTQFNFVDSEPSSIGGPDMSQQNFDAPSHLGAGSFTIAAGTPDTLLSGKIVVAYNLYNGDPTSGGIQQGGMNYITSNASVQVAPEPETLLLMGTALAGVGLLLRCARH